MAFHTIAYGSDEQLPLLLTIDDRELLAYDATTEAPKWRLLFDDPLVTTAFVAPSALPGRQAANPFRTTSTSQIAVAIDVRGRVHVVDITLGTLMYVIGDSDSAGDSLGKPIALATTSSTSSVALATVDTLHVWRNGERSQVSSSILRARVRALAFSVDGKTLAVGTDKGEVIFFAVGDDSKSPLAETSRTKADAGAIADIVQHPKGTWIACGTSGVASISHEVSSPVTNLSRAMRVRYDQKGTRLAVQYADKSIVVLDWPRLSVLMRIEYSDRPICGFEFGPDNWLGIAIDHGDANKIDVVTSSVHRTDTHPDRPHRTWKLFVQGSKAQAEKEAEELRRLQAQYTDDGKTNEQPAAAAPFAKTGARVGIGAMISIALLSLRVCAMSSRSSTPHYNYNPTQFGTLAPHLAPVGSACDQACVTRRLDMLRTECNTAELGCATQVDEVQREVLAGRCKEAKAAFAKIPTEATDTTKAPLYGSVRTLVETGLESPCASGQIVRPTQMSIVTLSHIKAGKNGPSAVSPTGSLATTSSDEVLPIDRDGETPEAIWAGADESIFVVTSSNITPDRRIRYRLNKTGTWMLYTQPLQSAAGRTSISGRTASDVNVAIEDNLLHFDGTSWTRISTAPTGILEVSGAGTSTFVTRVTGVFNEIHRQVGPSSPSSAFPTWVSEKLPDEYTRLTFATNTSPSTTATLWALGARPSLGHVLLSRAANGIWSTKTPPATTVSLSELTGIWVSPTGPNNDVFLYGTGDKQMLRSKNNGETWSTLELPSEPQAMWGRSSNDVYAVTNDGLARFDGKVWKDYLITKRSGGGFAGGARPPLLAGTPTEILLLRAEAAPDSRTP